jgi:hypothetical protein
VYTNPKSELLGGRRCATDAAAPPLWRRQSTEVRCCSIRVRSATICASPTSRKNARRPVWPLTRTHCQGVASRSATRTVCQVTGERALAAQQLTGRSMTNAHFDTRCDATARQWRTQATLRRLACTLTATLLLAMPIGYAQTPYPNAVGAALPPICQQPLSADRLPQIAEFIWAGCPQLLNWPHDAAIRMSGPSPLGTKSVHGFVLNYYAPSVYAWLKAGAAGWRHSGWRGDSEADVHGQQRETRCCQRLDPDGEEKKRVLRWLVLGLGGSAKAQAFAHGHRRRRPVL